MSTWFLHSVLKYRHNQAVEEELNIGVLFYFPAEGHLHLAHPKKLNRLEHTYPAIKTKDIKAYLNSFAAKARKLEKQKIYYQDDLQSLIYDKFLTPNGSSLYFGSVKRQPVWRNTLQTIEHFTNTYLEGYSSTGTSSDFDQHHERYILSKYRDLLETAGKAEQLSLLYKEEPVVVKSNLAHLETDAFWQNGTKNLLKAVSLDLKSEEGIENKALIISKKLELLCNQLVQNNQRVDLLLSAPQNKELKQVYHAAIQILENTAAPHKVVDEAAYKSYSKDFWSTAKPV